MRYKIFYPSILRESNFCENGVRKRKTSDRINQPRYLLFKWDLGSLISRLRTLVNTAAWSAYIASDLLKGGIQNIESTVVKYLKRLLADACRYEHPLEHGKAKVVPHFISGVEVHWIRLCFLERAEKAEHPKRIGFTIKMLSGFWRQLMYFSNSDSIWRMIDLSRRQLTGTIAFYTRLRRLSQFNAVSYTM